MTIACLKGFGKMPFLRDKLTSFVNEGRMSIHCFTICVGHGSREQVFEGASLINLRTSLSVTTGKGTESWRLLVWVKKLRSGVFEGVSDIFNFINEK